MNTPQTEHATIQLWQSDEGGAWAYRLTYRDFYLRREDAGQSLTAALEAVKDDLHQCAMRNWHEARK